MLPPSSPRTHELIIERADVGGPDGSLPPTHFAPSRCRAIVDLISRGGSVGFSVSPPATSGTASDAAEHWGQSLIALSHNDSRRVFLNSLVGDLTVCELGAVTGFLSRSDKADDSHVEEDCILAERVTLVENHCLGMQWSPDGSRLAFIVASSPWLQWHVWDRFVILKMNFFGCPSFFVLPLPTSLCI